MTRLPLIYVEFYDHATGNNGWMTMTELHEYKHSVLPNHAIGWVARETKTTLTLIPWKVIDDHNSSCRMYIVKSTITYRRRVKLDKRGRPV